MKTRYLILPACLCVCGLVHAGPADLDPTFNAHAGWNADVSSIAVQPDGNILVSGVFSIASGAPRNYVARLKPNGDLDETFNPVGGPDGNVFALALQPDGKVLINGSTNFNGGIGGNRVVRLNADGSLDSTFAPGAGNDIGGEFNGHDLVYPLLLQPDGKVVVAGYFTLFNGISRNRLARLNADGSVDLTFDPAAGPNDRVRCMALQADGKLLIGGAFTTVNGTNRNAIARLNADGSLDSGFDLALADYSFVEAIVVQGDGKIFVGGNSLVRFNSDGSRDASFTPPQVDGAIFSTTVQPNGKILIGGDFGGVLGVAMKDLARLNPNGTLDSSFDVGAGISGTNVSKIALQRDGKILVSGLFDTYNNVPQPELIRLQGDPVLLNVRPAGNQMVFSWIDPTFSLQCAPLINGVYTNVIGATNPYTNDMSGAQKFFRLIAN